MRLNIVLLESDTEKKEEESGEETGERRGERYRVKRWHHPLPPHPSASVSLIYPSIGSSLHFSPLVPLFTHSLPFPPHLSDVFFLNKQVQLSSLNKSHSVWGWVCDTERRQERKTASVLATMQAASAALSLSAHAQCTDKVTQRGR